MQYSNIGSKLFLGSQPERPSDMSTDSQLLETRKEEQLNSSDRGERSTVCSSYDNEEFDGFVPNVKVAQRVTHGSGFRLTEARHMMFGISAEKYDTRGSFQAYICAPASPSSPFGPVRSAFARDSDINMTYIHEMLFDEREFYPEQKSASDQHSVQEESVGAQNDGNNNGEPEDPDEEGVSKKTLKNRARRKRQHARKMAMKAELKQKQLEEIERQQAMANFKPPPGLMYPGEHPPPYPYGSSLFTEPPPGLMPVRLQTAPPSPTAGTPAMPAYNMFQRRYSLPFDISSRLTSVGEYSLF
jgi:hypothetical protein